MDRDYIYCVACPFGALEMTPMQAAWLESHPSRTEEWLVERLKDWFSVHAIDGDEMNLSPDNLVLIDHDDHRALRHQGLTTRIEAEAIRFWKEVRSQEPHESLVRHEVGPASNWLDEQLAQVMGRRD